jgi:hypothetical protein
MQGSMQPITLVFLGALSCLVLVGCGHRPVDRSSGNVPISNQQKDADLVARVNELEQRRLETEEVPFDFYSRDAELNFYVDPSGKDCIGLVNGDSMGGDLLRTLEKNETFRFFSTLQTYVPEYVRTMDELIEKTLPPNQGFYAFYACHLKNGVDLAAGYVWPRNETPYEVRNDMLRVKDSFYKTDPLFLIAQGKVHRFDIQTIINTATGGEVRPCEMILQGNAFEWKCFTGLGEETKNGMTSTFGTFHHWLIGLDGKIQKEWDSRN